MHQVRDVAWPAPQSPSSTAAQHKQNSRQPGEGLSGARRSDGLSLLGQRHGQLRSTGGQLRSGLLSKAVGKDQQPHQRSKIGSASRTLRQLTKTGPADRATARAQALELSTKNKSSLSSWLLSSTSSGFFSCSARSMRSRNSWASALRRGTSRLSHDRMIPLATFVRANTSASERPCGS